MRKMKDSGIEWAGNIPDTWHIDKGKYIMSLLSRQTLETDEVITCFRDGEVTLRSKRREEGFTISLTEVGYQGIEVGDLVVHGMDGFAGAIGISDSRGKATPVLNVLDTSENKRFMMYLMRTMAYRELFLSLSTGIRVRSCDTNWRKLREIDYIIPPKEEQIEIADFLDNECNELNQLVSEIQSQIETLEDYKRSVITEAVTRGIKSNVEMKNSEIESFKVIPKHWKIVKIKWLLRERNERSIFGEEEPLSMSQKYGIVPTSQMDIVPNMASSFVGAKITYVNDLVFNKLKAHLGVFAVSNYYGLVSPDYAVYYASEKSMVKYLEYLFKTENCIFEFKRRSTGVGAGLTRLYTDDLFDIKVPLPPLQEQMDIAEFLNKKTTEINLIIAEKQKQIDTIEEYKKSLIFEYVTGKKEVPHV